MAGQKAGSAVIVGLALLFFLTAPARAQIAIGNAVVRGSAEVGGLPTDSTTREAKFEEYRDILETAIAPQLQLMIGGKKEDFYLHFDATDVGEDDQTYQLRFGRYGLLDLEMTWDQIPHFFSRDIARTPYARKEGTYTLASRPTSFTGTAVQDWIQATAGTVDLRLFQGIGRFKLRYTPTPGWSFTGSYWSQYVRGKRALGALFGPNPGSFNITEILEPLDYQTHNVEVGGEYAGKGWSLGLQYQGSFFHNSISTLIWDNPIHTAPGGVCTDSATYTPATGTGPCRGRLDLYPSNQAHTFTLTGAATLPFQSRFMGTASYGWRWQNDDFLPFTINSAVTQPAVTRRGLGGDVRPFLLNATLVNRFFTRLDLKASYRYYDFDNRSRRVFFPEGIIVNDQGSAVETGLRSFPWAYSRQHIGLDASYAVTRWLSARLGYGWERMHRERREVLNANEHTVGPTFDLMPTSWLVVRTGYKRSWRDAHRYDAGRFAVVETEDSPEEVRAAQLAVLRKYDEAARNRDQYSLFTQVTPWNTLTLTAEFDFNKDHFPGTAIGLKNDINYVPSIGLTYAPLDWMSLFADYNWEGYDWKMRAMERTATTQTPSSDPNRLWISRGKDQVHTFDIGSDLTLIKNLLGFRIQYTFSDASSLTRASGNSAGTAASDFPRVTSQWHELLARFDYRLYRGTTLKFGYYFNHFTESDFGVDVMDVWMGQVDTTPSVQRSIFLGDRIKTPYTAHLGFVALRWEY